MSGVVLFILNLYRPDDVWSYEMQTYLSCGIKLALFVKCTDDYFRKCNLSPPSSVEGKGLSNLSIGKSRLEGSWRSLGFFGFYIKIIYVGAEVLVARNHSSA